MARPVANKLSFIRNYIMKIEKCVCACIYLALIQLKNPLAYVVQEVLVVRNGYACAGVLAKELFEPLHRPVHKT
jgi:hypothetical protein